MEFPHQVLEGLWRYLDDLLHSKKLRLLLKPGKTLSVRLNMAQVILTLKKTNLCDRERDS